MNLLFNDHGVYHLYNELSSKELTLKFILCAVSYLPYDSAWNMKGVDWNLYYLTKIWKLKSLYIGAGIAYLLVNREKVVRLERIKKDLHFYKFEDENDDADICHKRKL